MRLALEYCFCLYRHFAGRIPAKETSEVRPWERKTIDSQPFQRLRGIKQLALTFLAIEKDGLHAFEEFVLARYFMFIQVYFHKTRRILDRMLVDYLKEKLPGGKYPEDVSDYLRWDDGRIWEMLRSDTAGNEAADRLVNRRVLKKVYESSTHCGYDEIKTFKLLRKEL